MAESSIQETAKNLDALNMDDVESDSQQIKTEQLTDPENQDDFQLAALRLVEQNRIAVQNNSTLLSNEHYEELDSVTEGRLNDINFVRVVKRWPAPPGTGQLDCIPGADNYFE